jgi:adenylate cyclase
MNIFDSYTNRVKSTLQQDKINRSMTESYKTFSTGTTLVKARAASIGAIRRDLQPESSLLTLARIVRACDLSAAKVGQHPDFCHLIGTEETEMHYITSAFIDIKGSTRLHDSYELDTLYNVTNTILSAAIHVCLLYGGHIQRIQGDGIFVYFGGKSVDKADSVRQAIAATAMFTYFVKNDMQKLFEEDEVENISTRIGIDFGDDDEVLWGNFGVANCTELTTQSLHTSLASKCQGHAGKNGIVVGQHVVDRLETEEKYFDYLRDSKGEVRDRYVFIGPKRSLYYSQYDFDWLNYLKSLPYIRCDKEGNLYVLSQEEQEEEKRLDYLRQTAGLIQSGSAFTSPTGQISADPAGVKNQPHRFHYE